MCSLTWLIRIKANLSTTFAYDNCRYTVTTIICAVVFSASSRVHAHICASVCEHSSFLSSSTSANPADFFDISDCWQKKVLHFFRTELICPILDKTYIFDRKEIISGRALRIMISLCWPLRLNVSCFFSGLRPLAGFDRNYQINWDKIYWPFEKFGLAESPARIVL